MSASLQFHPAKNDAANFRTEVRNLGQETVVLRIRDDDRPDATCVTLFFETLDEIVQFAANVAAQAAEEART